MHFHLGIKESTVKLRQCKFLEYTGEYFFRKIPLYHLKITFCLNLLDQMVHAYTIFARYTMKGVLLTQTSVQHFDPLWIKNIFKV